MLKDPVYNEGLKNYYYKLDYRSQSACSRNHRTGKKKGDIITGETDRHTQPDKSPCAS